MKTTTVPVRLRRKVDEGLSSVSVPLQNIAGRKLALTTSGFRIVETSATSFISPPVQNHHLTLSFMARARLAFLFPPFSRHCRSRSLLFPRKAHHSDRQPGRTSPLASRTL